MTSAGGRHNLGITIGEDLLLTPVSRSNQRCLLGIGLRPGPLLFKEGPDVVAAIFAGLLLANVLILILGVVSVRLFPRVLKIPPPVLFPIIFTLCFLGSFSLNNSTYDMFVALVFGVIGYIMQKNGFPAAPTVLGVILGPIAEDALARSLIISRGDWGTLFRSPIGIFFYVISSLSVAYSLRRQFAARKTEREQQRSE